MRGSNTATRKPWDSDGNQARDRSHRRTVTVVHRYEMFAEGLATALAHQIGIVAVRTLSGVPQAEERSERGDGVVLDSLLPDAVPAVYRMRARGVRTVLLVEGAGPHAGPTVSPRAPIAALAHLLATHDDGSGDLGNRELSAREREVLALVAQGYAAKQVARQLNISVKTVEHHKSSIFRKLGVPNQAAAVRTAMVRGLV
jgi:DNA-binding CsgD family transcriptional regulator